MNVLLENLWIWGVVAAAVFLAGIYWYQQTGRVKELLWLTGSGLAIFALGLLLVFFVQTDRKAVQQTIKNIAAAVADNNVDRILEYIDEDALSTVEKAKFHMSLAHIDWAKIRDFHVVNMNYFTPQPVATVSFRGSVGGRSNVMDSSFTVVVQFIEVELVKGDDGQWRVTDLCRFSYPGYRG